MPTPSSFKTKTLPLLALLLVAIVWGSGFVVSQFALDAKLSPVGILLGRFAVAAVLLGLLFFRDIRRKFKPYHLKGGLICGTLLFFAFLLQTIGLSRSTPANNAFITACNVALVPFLWWGVNKKRPQKIYFICSLLSLAGVAILSVNFSGGFSLRSGDMLTFLSAVLFASQIVATGIFARNIPPTVLVFIQFMVCALLSLFAFLLTGESFSSFATAKGAVSLLYLGMFSTLLCFFLQTVAQKYVAPSKAAILLSTESLFGSLFSVLLGFDAASPRMFIGGAIMFAAILLPEIRDQKNNNSKNITSE